MSSRSEWLSQGVGFSGFAPSSAVSPVPHRYILPMWEVLGVNKSKKTTLLVHLPGRAPEDDNVHPCFSGDSLTPKA